MSAGSALSRQLGFLLVLASTACGRAEPVARAKAAIFAGAAAPGDTSVVAVVNFAGGQCSGSLIAPRLVLTARHCVADTAGKEQQVVCGVTTFIPPDSPGAIFIVPLPAITENPDDYVAVADIRMPDGLDDDLCGTDVVLLRLKEPLAGLTPLSPRVEAAVEPGEAYSAVGFGVDEALDDNPSGVRKRGEGYEVRCSGAACRARDIFDNEWVGSGGPCSGDSGGPAFDADGSIIGVVSRGESGCTLPVFSDVASRADWLKAEAIAAANDALEPPPAWAPCDAQNPCVELMPPEPEPEPEPKADGPEATCTLSRAPSSGPSAWSCALGAALLILRRRRIETKGRHGSFCN
jgi:hypothetical protein